MGKRMSHQADLAGGAGSTELNRGKNILRDSRAQLEQQEDQFNQKLQSLIQQKEILAWDNEELRQQSHAQWSPSLPLTMMTSISALWSLCGDSFPSPEEGKLVWNRKARSHKERGILEIQLTELKGGVDSMRGRTSYHLINKTVQMLSSSPFSPIIIDVEVPIRFIFPKFQAYDGLGYSMDHLMHYCQLTHINVQGFPHKFSRTHINLVSQSPK